jgi:hypothetical protein
MRKNPSPQWRKGTRSFAIALFKDEIPRGPIEVGHDQEILGIHHIGIDVLSLVLRVWVRTIHCDEIVQITGPLPRDLFLENCQFQRSAWSEDPPVKHRMVLVLLLLPISADFCVTASSAAFKVIRPFYSQ